MHGLAGFHQAALVGLLDLGQRTQDVVRGRDGELFRLLLRRVGQHRNGAAGLQRFRNQKFTHRHPLGFSQGLVVLASR